MSPRKRRALALAVIFTTLICLQCAEKEGPVDPFLETEPPEYTIVSVTASPARIEPGEQTDIVAAVEDRDEQPVEGYELEFSTDFGTIEPSATTNEDGIAAVKYFAPSTTGYATITVTGEGAWLKTTHVQVGEGMLIVNPLSILADGISTATVSLQLVDGLGLPVKGAGVAFSADFGLVIPASVETDSSGYAVATYVSAPNFLDVVANIEAEISYQGSQYTELASVFLRGVSISVSAVPAQLPADGSSSAVVSAWLKETTAGVPIAGAEINFGTSLGVIGGSGYTDQEGFADVYFLSGTTPGVAEVRASYGLITGLTYVTLGSLNLSLRAPFPKMVADGISTQFVEAVLITEDNNPVSGVTVDFSTSAGIITKNATTDYRGKADVMLTAADHEATAEVTASFSGIYDDMVEVAFEDPVLELRASPMTVTVLPTNISQITVYLSFGDGSPVPDDTPVHFTTTEGVITSYRSTSSGIAAVDLHPSGVASTNVVVKASAGNSSASTQVIFTPDIPTNIVVSALPEAIPGDGSSFSTIVAEVTDVYGNYVEDGTVVSFSVAGGNGIVTPSALTSSGIATAQFVPTGGGGIAVVTASCPANLSAAGDVAIMIESGAAGAIIADPDTAWIAVAETWDNSQATVTALVLDSNRNPVADGTDVSFEIVTAPGGGEYIDAVSTGYGPAVRQTLGGAASVNVNSGTKPGTILMSISSPGAPSTACKIGVAAGPPDSILINANCGEGAINGDGTYTIAVSATVRDKHNNPVENGTSVYFTLGRSDIGFINPETYTGNGYPCVELEGNPIKGVTRACLTYPSESVFECVAVMASTNGGEVQSTHYVGLPIFDGSVGLQALPTSADGTAGDTVDVYVTVRDHYNHIIDNATLVFSVDGDGYVVPATAVTDDTGFPLATLIIPPGTQKGKTKVKAKVWMIDIEGDIEVSITE